MKLFVPFECTSTLSSNHPYAFMVCRRDRARNEVSISQQDATFKAARVWCGEQFGDNFPQGQIPPWASMEIACLISFRDAIDATAFKLRWC